MLWSYDFIKENNKCHLLIIHKLTHYPYMCHLLIIHKLTHYPYMISICVLLNALTYTVVRGVTASLKHEIWQFFFEVVWKNHYAWSYDFIKENNKCHLLIIHKLTHYPSILLWGGLKEPELTAVFYSDIFFKYS